MRRFLLVCGLVLLVGTANAQGVRILQENASNPSQITKGEFAQLLLRNLGARDAAPEPAAALLKTAELELMPASWNSNDPLTHQDLVDVVSRLAVNYAPTSPDSNVSKAFAEALLSSNKRSMQEQAFELLGFTFTSNEIKRPLEDDSRARGVSSSGF